MTTKIGARTSVRAPRKDPGALVETRKPEKTTPTEWSGPRVSPAEAERAERAGKGEEAGKRGVR